MKSIIFLFFAYTAVVIADQEFQIPPEIANGLARSEAGEGIGFGIKGVDETVLRDYIKANWRAVADHIEYLPQSIPREGFISSSKEQAFNASVVNFAVACECLPPLEYLDFLDKLLSLYEEKRISFMPIDLTFTGRDRKYYFLAVNWEHSRVQALCARALKIIPATKESSDLINLIEVIRTGKIADNYLPDEGVDIPPPETLPGIKLQRPFDSLIRKYERLTGKKEPQDPQFNPRPDRRNGAQPDAPAVVGGEESESFRWKGLLFILAILSGGIFWRKFRTSWKAASLGE